MKDYLDTKLILTGVVMFLILAVIGNGVTYIPKFFKGIADESRLEKIESNVKAIGEAVVIPYEEKNTMKKALIIEDFSNSAEDGEPTDYAERFLETKGDFKNGYFYIKASVNNSWLSKGEDVYAKMIAQIGRDYEEYGGHLIKQKSLYTPDSGGKTEYLFKLDDIKYKEGYTDKDIEVTSANWLQLLNDFSGQKVITFVSTVKDGTVHELSFYYNCSMNSDCSISVK